jgi:phosphate starvation-inducible protein PhoH
MKSRAKLSVELHSPLTAKQQEILRDRNKHQIITGPAGTGKTYINIARGLLMLSKGEVDQIIIARSLVPTRDIGFLPGNLEEKSEPYELPYKQLFGSLVPNKFDALISAKQLVFMPTSFLRGTTFDDAYLIVDEYQNLSGHELHSIVTRVGTGTYLNLIGDEDQSDLVGAEKHSTRREFEILKSMQVITSYTFDVADIVRSDFVKSYYKARAVYAKEEAAKKAAL